MLAAFALIAVIAVIISLKSDKEGAAENFQLHNDFESSDEGTIMFWTNLHILRESVGNADYIILFSSERIKGLKIIYDVMDFRLKGGIPLIGSYKEINFDGNRHHIAYTFRKNGKQALYFDGNIVAEGNFVYKGGNEMTGFAVYSNKLGVDASYEAKDADVYDKALSNDEIRGMFASGR